MFNDLSEVEVQVPKVKVVLINSSGGVSVRTLENKRKELLVKNVALKNWTAVANIIFDDTDSKPHLLEAISRKVSDEFKNLCSSTTSSLKYASADQLFSFSNKFVVYETTVHCPIWHSVLSGAAGVAKPKRLETLEKYEYRKNMSTNHLALATAAIAKFRNPEMSALAKRISVVLLHSGAKAQDFTRLNHLGVSTSHKDAIRVQRSLGSHHDSKLLIWKDKIEAYQKSKKLLDEIRHKQLPRLKEDDMETEGVVDFHMLKSSKYFTEEIFQGLMKMFAEFSERGADHT